MQCTHQHEYILRTLPDAAASVPPLPQRSHEQTVHIGCVISQGAAEPIRSVLCTGYLWSDEPGAWVWTQQAPTAPAPGHLCPRCATCWQALEQEQPR